MIITLLTDLGTRDATVATAKAALQQHFPETAIAGITHHVSRHNWREAAYVLMSAYHSFPRGTVHLIPVAVFSERQPRMIFAEKDGHFFIAPDNGLLPIALGDSAMDTTRLIHQFTKPYSLQLWFKNAIDMISLLSTGTEIPAARFSAFMPPLLPPPQVTPINIVCRILYADRYQNLVVNITKDEFKQHVKDGPFRIRTFKGGNITTISQHYNEVPEGSPLCRFNKAGYLEIAVNHGSAMEMFGMDAIDPTVLDYHSVRISV